MQKKQIFMQHAKQSKITDVIKYKQSDSSGSGNIATKDQMLTIAANWILMILL